jgi:hypothetical protein
MMLRLLEALGQTPGPANAWGLTSHENLVLLPVDDFQSPWHVTLLAAGDYYVIGGMRKRPAGLPPNWAFFNPRKTPPKLVLHEHKVLQ